MPYVSLYRKYRSQTFEDVMGQDHVVKTLQNAIRQSKVAHAYLFCGTRGTGKTTTARLLAKALNCASGPTPQPCNVCPACVSITEGSAMDIVELDAASHRSIKDIEEIRDNVKFPPMELRYKVFIIDEAHQLSSDAKDAFLKTLEEPPAHAIFILATTEAQNIPVTIRSRCQQFDFRRGSLKDLRERLKYVTDSEGVKADDPALDLMAVNADGSWRDALSLLEQILAYTDGHITADDVNTVLGTVTVDFLFRLAETLAEGNEASAFEAAAEAVGSGKEIQQLLRSIANHFRNLLFALVTKNPGDLTTNAETAAHMKEQASKFSKQSLLRGVEIFTEAEREARYSEQHRLLLELALLRTIEACRPVEFVPVAATNPVPQTSAARPAPEAHAPRRQPSAKEEAPVQKQPEIPSAIIDHGAHGQQNLPEFDRIVQKWNVVLQHVKTVSKPSHALLAEAAPASIQNGSLVLQFKHQGQMDIFSADASRKKPLQTAIERVFGVPNVSIICKKEIDANTAPSSTPAPARESDSAEQSADPGQEILNNVLDIFDGEIIGN